MVMMVFPVEAVMVKISPRSSTLGIGTVMKLFPHVSTGASWWTRWSLELAVVGSTLARTFPVNKDNQLALEPI